MKVLFINTGGTFNKYYNPLNGNLEVSRGDEALQAILQHHPHLDYEIINVLHKDSLDMDDSDRLNLLQIAQGNTQKKIIIIHGTDTMTQSAQVLKKHRLQKTIILTGAMKPFEIEPLEATSNINLCLGFLKANSQGGVHIAMSGLLLPCDQIIKNKTKGVFEMA